MTELTYKDAGVDQTRKDAFVDDVIKLMRRTYSDHVIDKPWGFGGLFRLGGQDTLFSKKHRDPVLVACADGVGTKLKIAFDADRHDTVGIDLVAMNVNDLIVQGAKPLFFLDYIAIGKTDERMLGEVIKGIVRGCELAGCALLGGETAEMPGFYKDGEYELAGFAVGIVEQSRMIDGSSICVGDDVIAIASSGLHSNGYSLARKVLLEKAGLELRAQIPGMKETVEEELLKPTIIYARVIEQVLASYRVKRAVKGIANITGGGLIENIPRILPPGCCVEIEPGSWPVPPVFEALERLGNIGKEEMYRVFNMGVGMVIVSDPFYSNAICRRIYDAGNAAYLIGRVRRGRREVVIG
ncbi:MAG: phosphoribosylformylglycinamidine cyclo-ligase [Planctomycetota bacterium]|nr:phosphoribosylformylglycinamidine cyclo-ligase [Planctomycetota bacterium]